MESNPPALASRRAAGPGPALLTGALALALLVSACSDQGEAVVDEPDATADEPRRVINVQVEALGTEDFVDVILATGVVVADRQVTVAAEEAGTVTELRVDRGDRVEAGQLLARLDDDLLRAQRDEAQAQASLARELWNRVRRLYEEDGIGTESGYLESRFAHESARARLVLAEERLARTAVHAPFAGVVDVRHVEIGSQVAPGAPVLSILDLEPLQVATGVPERYAADVHVGSRALVVFPSLADTTEARVSYVGAAVHPGNRTFEVELDIDAAPAAVKPEMVADVVLERRVLSEVVVVPRQALVRTEDGFAAFVVVADGDGHTAQARTVELGPSGQDRVVVTGGLQPADRLIVVGQNQVAAGDRVRIVSGL